MAGLLSLPNEPYRLGLLSPQLGSAVNEARALPTPAAAPQRRRGEPGFLTYFLGGSEGLDAERARRRAEDMRPQLEARRAQLRAMAESMGPAAVIAFETNPEKFGENLAQQYAPQVIAAGGVQSVIGNGARVSAPRDIEFGDSLVRTDPLQPAPQTLMQRGPTYAEQTAQQNADTTRFNAENPVLGANATWVGPDGSPRAQGYIAPNVSSVSEGADLVVTDPTGRIINRTTNAAETRPEDAQKAAQARAARVAMADNLQTGLSGARQYVRSAGVWNQYNPLNRQARANLEGHLDTIKGNITFERLSEMKANSPNGASGLGALSDNESRMLASTVAALNADMSPQELQRSFEIIDRLVAKMREEGSAATAPAGTISREAAIAEARRRGLIR